jgi:iron(III) transport system substrate-binding protein
MTRWSRTLPVVAIFLCALSTGACRRQTDDGAGGASVRQVTAYISADRPFSEPVIREYERRSGVRVDVVYDTEETKSTGLANRLLAEKERPHADVFWSNEPVRTLVLKSRGVLAPYRSPSAAGIPETFKDPEGYWTGFSARLRVIVYNTTLVPAAQAPTSVLDLADAKWRNQVAIADPRFGSTSFHVAALYAQLGDARADAFFTQLKANGVRIVDGNSVVRDLVAKGEIKVGLTDTDDVNVALESGLPVGMVLPDREGLGVPVMPNMVSLIAGAPHREEGQRLVDFLLSPDAERMLAASDAVQIPLHPTVEPPPRMPRIDTIRPMTLDYAKAAARVDEVTRRLQTLLGL